MKRGGKEIWMTDNIPLHNTLYKILPLLPQLLPHSFNDYYYCYYYYYFALFSGNLSVMEFLHTDPYIASVSYKPKAWCWLRG